jgi:hypothetical protein
VFQVRLVNENRYFLEQQLQISTKGVTSPPKTQGLLITCEHDLPGNIVFTLNFTDTMILGMEKSFQRTLRQIIRRWASPWRCAGARVGCVTFQ